MANAADFDTHMTHNPSSRPDRQSLVGRRIEGVRLGAVLDDDTENTWTVLTLDNGQQLLILDQAPWVWVEPEVM